MSSNHEETGEEFPGRKLVGARLRQLRADLQITARTAGDRIGASEAKISRLERGLLSFRRRDLIGLLTLYGVTDPYQQETLVSVALGERKPSWWDHHEVPLEETAVWNMEQTADLIRTYHSHFIPWLLQTERYAVTACQVTQYPRPPASVVETSVKNLLRRQQILNEDGPRVWAMIEEPVLWRPIAGVDAQIQQLDALINVAHTPKITIQVNPLDSAFIPACEPFTMFRFADDRPQMVATHRQTGDEITERHGSEIHAMTFDRLAVAAHRARDAVATLTRIRDYISSVADS